MPPEASHRVWESQPANRFEGDEDTKLAHTDAWVIGGTNPITETISAGQSYFFPRYAFHETVVKKLAITGMTRFNHDQNHRPRVLCRVDEVPSNEFDKHGFEEEAIWKSVFDLINMEIRITKPRPRY